MPFIETGFSGLKVFEPRVFADSRGYFFESFNENEFLSAGIHVQFVQDNESLSSRGVLRGLHYQLNPHAQSKLVRVIRGAVLDVAVDLRKGSPTFGKHFSIILDSEKKNQLFIPRGFAHGFAVLSDEAIFAYKCDGYYHKSAEGGIHYADNELGIDWHLPADAIHVSEKDLVLPSFAYSTHNFTYGI